MIEEIQEVVDALCAQTEQLQKDKTQIAELAARLEAELYAVLTERNVQADEIEQLRMQLADHGEEITRLEEALRRIVEWSQAYPLAIFPKPDLQRAHVLLQAGGMSIDSISADAMRHVVESVGKIAADALAGGKP